MGLVNKQMLNTCFFLHNSVLEVAAPSDSWFHDFLVRICAGGFYFQRSLFAFILNLNFLGLGTTEFG